MTSLLPVLALAVLGSAADLPAEVREAPARPDTLVLEGTVRAPGYRPDGLLPGALVEVRQGERSWSAVADGRGTYRLTGLEAGVGRVSVSHLAAHRLDLEVRLPVSGTVTLDLELERRAIPLPPLAIRSHPGLTDPVAPRSRGDHRRARIGLRALEATSGIAESGLAALASQGLGEGEVRDPQRALFMRGTTVDARMVLLDGAPVLTPFHVAGLVAPFDSDLLGDASLFLGAAPSRYQGGLSYLLDVDTRAPRRDRTRVQVSADALSFRSLVETPLPGAGGLMVGGRALHGLPGPMGGGEAFPYDYRDFLARVGFGLGAGHQVALTHFGNREGVRLDLDPDDPGAGDEAHWGNRVFSLRYGGAWGPLRVRAAGAASDYTSALPVAWEDPVLARADQARRSVGTDLELPLASGVLGFGASVERMVLGYHLEPRAAQPTTLVAGARAELATTTTATYAEWEGEAGDGVTVRGGLRAERTGHDGRTRLAPRVGVRFLLGESAIFHAAAGGFHQVVPSPGLQGFHPEEAPDVLTWNPRLTVASASHLVAGLDQELNEDLRLEVSGFAKGFRSLGLGEGVRSRASGVELRMARDGERLGGWLGYTLSWFWTEEGAGGSTRFDGRHLLSAGVRTVPVGGLEVGGSLGYGAGLPFSAVTLDEATLAPGDSRRGVQTISSFGTASEEMMNAGGGTSPLELAPPRDFLRLDLEVSWLLEPTLRGRSTELRPYLRALNALNRRDALFYYFDRWRDEEVRPVTQRPFLPLVGVEWRF